ncbi:unnamed protein product [Clavelina lepadiformis]|uniref:Fatty acyl-CoA reductase n=1 Tax=Clavelina lepadiformis TaxID=159417 RepID=A0ABP0EYN5_CLALP
MSDQYQDKINNPSIPQFFADKTVAVSGATGFLGQCVIEKILRKCPNVKKILVFVREKRNLTVIERMEQYGKLPVFDKLRKEQPDFLQKIVTLPSNFEKTGFDLSEENLQLLQEEVNIFVHCAATVRFDEHLRLAFKMNTVGVRSVIKLCRTIKNLVSLVHISTAYSYCDRKLIGEEIYPTGWDFDKLHDAMQWMTDDMITKLTPDILKDRPNTYTLTKAFAEEVLAKEGEGLPICIVRPSIIGAVYRDPVPGWISNLHGATGLVLAYGKGMLHSLWTKSEVKIDVIPAEYVVNCILAAAWKTGVAHEQHRRLSMTSLSGMDEDGDSSQLSRVNSTAKSLNCLAEADSTLIHKRRKSIPIYNIVVGDKIPITLGDLVGILKNTFYTYPLNDVFHIPFLQITPNKTLYRTIQFVMQYLPAYIFDTGLTMFGQKPKLLRYNQRIHESTHNLQLFLQNTWNWETKNVGRLQSQLSEEDRKVFGTTAHTVNYRDYLKQYAIGVKKFIMKEDLEGYPAARRRLWRLRVLVYCSQGILLMLVWRLLVSQTSTAKNLWHLFMSLWFKFLNFFPISSTLQKSQIFNIPFLSRFISI